jgi:hypothetical protein
MQHGLKFLSHDGFPADRSAKWSKRRLQNTAQVDASTIGVRFVAALLHGGQGLAYSILQRASESPSRETIGLHDDVRASEATLHAKPLASDDGEAHGDDPLDDRLALHLQIVFGGG